jgi:lambda family phage portal protein
MKIWELFSKKQIEKETAKEMPVDGKKYIEAGQLDRISSDFFGTLLSPNQEVRQTFSLIRGRSRELYENSPVMKSYVNILQQSLKPFKLISKVSNARKGINNKIAQQIEDAWKDYCKAGNFEASGRYSLEESLNQMIQAWAVDGELLLRRLRGKGPHGYQVQLVNTDLLAKDTMVQNASGPYAMGIERDEWDSPKFYWMHSKFMQESAQGGKLLKLPASDVIHAFRPHQIGACRGLPTAMASIPTIRLLDDYRKAELVAAKIGACMAVFYTQDGTLTSDPYNGSAAGPAAGLAGTGTSLIAMPSSGAIPGQILKPGITPNHISPGMAEALPAGITPHFLTPSHPNTAYEAYNNNCKLDIAAGIGLSYNTLYSDWQSTSFSSMKAAYNQDKQFIEDLQDFFITKVLDVIYEDWLDYACMSGVLDLAPIAGSYDIYKDHKFIRPAFPMPDPLKDIQAQVSDFALGTTSKSRLVAARGENYEEILIERQRDRELELKYGESDQTPTPSNDPAFGKPGAPANTPIQEPIGQGVQPSNAPTNPPAPKAKI